MKKYFMAVLSAVMFTFACAKAPAPRPAAAASASAEETQIPEKTSAPEPAQAVTAEPASAEETSGIDVDLTTMSSTMIYSQVLNMLEVPEDYTGKTVRMEGYFSVYQDRVNNKVYYSCVIPDATACCRTGIEFVYADEPERVPDSNTWVTVTGVFGTYEENGCLYCSLFDAVVENS